MEKNSFFLKGDIIWSATPEVLNIVENGFVLCSEGKSGGVYREVPKEYAHLPVKDYTDRLVIPGLTDLHIHAPQFSFRALGMDMELLEWLNKITFPEEAKYGDLDYASRAYDLFTGEIKKGATTRLCVFGTIHVPGTLLLMDKLEESGLVSLVGKVNMDRNCPDFLNEAKGNTTGSIAATSEWLQTFYKRRPEGRYKNTFPILTPRFIPVCSEQLLKQLAGIQKEKSLPLQSHLSENRKEVEWVKELCPNSKNYADAYDDTGLLDGPAIMAHCVWSDENEMDLLAKKGVYIAHCPQSNMNLSSGIAPVRRFLQKRIPLGLGSDVAGGAHTSIFRMMSDAIGVSKLRQAVLAPDEKALTLEEAFYLGTAGGGSFFGKIAGADFGPAGSFEKGRDFDAVIIDDSSLPSPITLKTRDRLERVVYLSDDRHIEGKFVRGVKIL